MPVCLHDHIPEQELASKACSGKCAGMCSREKAKTWVVAACNGAIAILQRNQDGSLYPLAQRGSTVSASVGEFSQWVHEATLSGKFDQLILVGSVGDIAWVQNSLPEEAGKRIVAEIRYPLVAGWMQQLPDLGSLSKVLEQVLTA